MELLPTVHQVVLRHSQETIMNKIHPKARAVLTPYGFFNSITDAAKYIYDNDKSMRKHWGGRHTYNTIVNLRAMVTKFCREERVGWNFYDE